MSKIMTTKEMSREQILANHVKVDWLITGDSGKAMCEAMTEYASLVTKEKDEENQILKQEAELREIYWHGECADLEAKLAQAIEFQKRAFSYGANGCSWEQFFTAQEKEAQESEKGGL